MNLREIAKKIPGVPELYGGYRAFQARRAANDKSEARFHSIVDDYFRQFQPKPEWAPDAAVFDKLIEAGIARVDGFATSQQIATIKGELLPGLLDVAAGTGPDYSFKYRDDVDQRYQIPVLRDQHPASFAFLNDTPYLNAMAAAYLGVKGGAISHTVELKQGTERIDRFGVAHFDSWQPRFKAFLYLEDVEHDNAPMTFYERTNVGTDWRFDLDYFAWRHGVPKLTLDVARDLVEKYHFKEHSMTGKAGDIYLVDNRGMHASTVLLKGRRLQTISIWRAGGTFNYRYA